MAQIISTNTASLIAQSNLNKSQATYTSAISQLSSGKKVNSAADNSAGLAISGRMQSQINGGTQAIANANDGIALAQTADSALSQITANLQSVRTLAVQAATATYSASDRASMNQQAQQLLTQINAIATQTQYNGQTLLDGSFGTASFQTGANAGQTSTVSLSQGVKTSQIGQTASKTVDVSGTGLKAATLSITMGSGASAATYAVGSAVKGADAGQDANSAYAAAQAINSANITGLTVTASNSQTFALNGTTSGALTGTSGNTVNLTINGVNVFGDEGLTFTDDSTTLSAGDLVAQINSVSGKSGVTASLNSDGTLKLDATDGRNITVTQSDVDANGVASTSEQILSSSNGSKIGTALQGTLSYSASTTISFSGSGAANVGGTAGAKVVGSTAVDLTQANNGVTLNVSLGGVEKAFSVGAGTYTASSLAEAIQNQLNSGTQGFGAGAFTVATDANGKLSISSNNGQDFSVSDASTALGVGNTNTASGSTAASMTSTQAATLDYTGNGNGRTLTFTKDGSTGTVTLSQKYASASDLAADIQKQLNDTSTGFGTGAFTVTADANGKLTIASNGSGSTANFTLTSEVDDQAAAVTGTDALGLAVGAQTGGANGGTVTGNAAAATTYNAASYTVTVGTTQKTVTLNGTYTATSLATSIEQQLNNDSTGFGTGAFKVSADANGTLSIQSASGDYTIAGSQANLDSLLGTTNGATSYSTSVAGTAGAAAAGTSVALSANVSSAQSATKAATASTIGYGSTTLANLSLTTAAGATAAIQSIDAALSTISELQGNVGAIQNRFDSTISNLNATVQNVTSAQSTITDADYSSVASTLSTADVLQQAGIAMVSKANQQPAQIMKLLQ